MIMGEGKAFCAGGSLEELKGGMDAVTGVGYMAEHAEIITLIAGIGEPVIAAVSGAAMGAGFSMVMACDMPAIASSTAFFASVFSKVGLVPDMGSLYYLPRIVGMHRAKEFIYTARNIKADEALQLEIVNQVVSPEELSHAHATWLPEWRKDLPALSA